MDRNALVEKVATELKEALSPNLAIRSLESVDFARKAEKLGMLAIRNKMLENHYAHLLTPTESQMASFARSAAIEGITLEEEILNSKKRIMESLMQNGGYDLVGMGHKQAGFVTTANLGHIPESDPLGAKFKALSPKAKELVNRISTMHELDELKFTGEDKAGTLEGRVNGKYFGHNDPRVIEREARLAKKVGEQYPEVLEFFKEMRDRENIGQGYPMKTKQLTDGSEPKIRRLLRALGVTRWNKAYNIYS